MSWRPLLNGLADEKLHLVGDCTKAKLRIVDIITIGIAVIAKRIIGKATSSKNKGVRLVKGDCD